MLHQFHSFAESTKTTQASLVEQSVAAQSIQRILKARRARSEHLPDGLFSDPAWDILLYLTMVDMEQRRASVNEACLQADAPHTTAIRYIGTLEDKGLVTRYEDRFDRRRKFVTLTDRGRRCMWAFLTATPHSDLRAA